jgi:hypothetical protein
MTARKFERVMAALHAQLASGLPAGAELYRNLAEPRRAPAAGMAILRDGEPGEPEVTLSPLSYEYRHRAELLLLAPGRDAATRDAALDALARWAGGRILADRTLGGETDWAEAAAPAPAEITEEGAEPMKGAVVAITLVYQTADPLG